MIKTIKFDKNDTKNFENNLAGFIEAVSFKESSSDLSLSIDHPINTRAANKVNGSGYMGLFQFGEEALYDLGYYLGDHGISYEDIKGADKKSPIRKRWQSQFDSNNWIGKWSGKRNINSKLDFLRNPQIQYEVIKEWIGYLCNQLRNNNLNEYFGRTIQGIEVSESGAIAGMHLVGIGGLGAFLGIPKFQGSKQIDGNGTHISKYIEMFNHFDLENCCKRKIYISLTDSEKSALANKEVVLVSCYDGKYVSGETRVRVKSDEHGKLPIIVRHPNTEIKIIVDGKESNSIIQKANEKQKATLSDFTVSSYRETLEAENSPQPKPQVNKTPQEVRNEQAAPSSPSVDSTSALNDIQFNVQIVEGDSGKPIPNMNFFLTYKGNIKKHTANNNGVRQGVVAEEGQDIEVSVEGDGQKQVIHHFKVSSALNNQIVKVKLPVHSFNITVTQDGKNVANTLFSIFYRGREIPKRTNLSGVINVRMLTGFVFGFGIKGKSLILSRVEKTVVMKGFTVNASAVKASKLYETADEQHKKEQQAETARRQQQQKEAQVESERKAKEEAEKAKTEADRKRQAKQDNSYTQNGGKPLTTVSSQAPVTSDTTRYHIYHNGKIKRENRAATGFAEFIYYDQNGGAHNLGKSRYVVAKRWDKKDVYGNGNIFLVDVRPFSSYRHGNIGYKMLMNSQQKRYYLGGVEMAAFLGGLCKSGYNDISFNGFSTVNGSPGESKSHLNGVAGDIRYLRKDKRTAAVILQDSIYDHQRTLILINNFILFGWGKSKLMISEYFVNKDAGVNSPYIFPRCYELKTPRHNNHLHLQGLQANFEDI